MLLCFNSVCVFLYVVRGLAKGIFPVQRALPRVYNYETEMATEVQELGCRAINSNDNRIFLLYLSTQLRTLVPFAEEIYICLGDPERLSQYLPTTTNLYQEPHESSPESPTQCPENIIFPTASTGLILNVLP